MDVKAVETKHFFVINRLLMEQLRTYLDDQEGRLADVLLRALAVTPQPTLPASGHLRLNQSLGIFASRVRSLSEKEGSRLSWESVVEAINHSLWSYVETLEGASTELVGQVYQVGFEQWSREFFQTAEAMKELLLHRMEDVIEIIQRLSKLLIELKAVCCGKRNLWLLVGSWVPFLSHEIDPKLVQNLRRSEKYLKARFAQFAGRYEDYRDIYKKVEKTLDKFQAFTLFHNLDDSHQRQFQQLYFLLKVFEENQKTPVFSSEEIVHAAEGLAPLPKAEATFKTYLKAHCDAIFQLGRLIKIDPHVVSEEQVASLGAELDVLRTVMEQYRDMLLKTDPNPYIRSRWGFTETVVGTEPKQTKGLMNWVFEAEKMDGLYSELASSIDPLRREDLASRVPPIQTEAENVLHAMAQPLISKTMMKRKIDHLLELLQECDELGNPNERVVPLVGKALSRILKFDWKYQVAMGSNLFHHLYDVHLGLLGSLDDRTHQNRLKRFEQATHHLIGIVQKQELFKSSHTVDDELSDIKAYLQDFLATAQRASLDSREAPALALEWARTFSQELLEYRYLFAKFYEKLKGFGSEGQSLRMQCLFIDHYGEAVDTKIEELEQLDV